MIYNYKIKEIDIKDHPNHYFTSIINIKNYKHKNTKVDQKSCHKRSKKV